MGWLKKYQNGGYSTTGYKADSPDRNNLYNIIPSGRITMQNVPHPVLGIDNFGNKQMMQPGGEYQFQGDRVFEVPAMKEGGIPQRYKNMGFSRVGQKKSGDGQHKWKVLAKKGDSYKVVQGGYRGMQDFKQHGSQERRDRFWDRMGGRDSAKAKDPFSPLYWHKRFGTWEYGGWLQQYQDGGSTQAHPEYSIVDYLASQGQDYSKGHRAELAQQYGVQGYDYSAEKNLELLSKLKAATSLPQKPAGAPPVFTELMNWPETKPVPPVQVSKKQEAFNRDEARTAANKQAAFSNVRYQGEYQGQSTGRISAPVPTYTPFANTHYLGEYQGEPTGRPVSLKTQTEPYFPFSNVFYQGEYMGQPTGRVSIPAPVHIPFADTQYQGEYQGQVMRTPAPIEQIPDSLFTPPSEYTWSPIANNVSNRNVPLSTTTKKEDTIIEDATKYVNNKIKSITKKSDKFLKSINIEGPGDLVKIADNYLQRQLIKNDPNLLEPSSNISIPKDYKPAIIVGSTIPENDRKIHQSQIVDLNQVKFGVRNRGEYIPIEGDGVVTTFSPFQKASKYFSKRKDPANASYIGVDDDGNIKVGQRKDFEGKEFNITRTFENKIIDFNKEEDGKIKLVKADPKASKTMFSPSIKVLDDNGKIIEGKLSLLVPKNKITNTFGSATGGRYIIKKQSGEQYLISGSLDDLSKAFYEIKGNDPYLNVYTLDNGSYSSGLQTRDKKITQEDLKNYDLQNTSGGNFAYIKPGNYSSNQNKYKEYYTQTPNVRTEKDESYKKGHSLKNEQSAIILHHTGFTEPDMKGVNSIFMTPGKESSHVVINFDGTRYRYANPDQVTFHAGESSHKGRGNVNDFGIGIEFQGDTNKKPLTDAQINSFVEYALPLIKAKKIKLSDITTHHKIAPGRKPDITDSEYERIIKRLKKEGVNENAKYEYGGPVPSSEMYKDGGMIKRADGSYSQRGLWDNIRANAGSGKKPTKEMLQQERKIKSAEKKEYGGWLNEYQSGGIATINGNTPTGVSVGTQTYQDIEHKPIVSSYAPALTPQEIFAKQMQAKQNESVMREYRPISPAYREQLEREYKWKEAKQNVVKPLLQGADVVTDVMQLGNFIPHPIAQGIGKVGNVFGTGVDALQAGMDLGDGNYGSAAINAGSMLVPIGLESQVFRRNSKYLRPGQPLYPFSPQASGSSKRVQYIEPFTATRHMTDNNLLANRALLGTLATETAADATQQYGGTIAKDGKLLAPSSPYLDMDPAMLQGYQQMQRQMEMLSTPEGRRVLAGETYQKDKKQKANKAKIEDKETLQRMKDKAAQQRAESDPSMFNPSFWKEDPMSGRTPQQRLYDMGTDIDTRVAPRFGNFTDYLQPANYAADVAKSILQAPLKSKQENSVMPYVRAAAEPIFMAGANKYVLDPLLGKAINVASPYIKEGINAVGKAGKFAGTLLNRAAENQITPNVNLSFDANFANVLERLRSKQNNRLSNLDLDEVRRAYHNGERLLSFDEGQLLRTHGVGERGNYVQPSTDYISGSYVGTPETNFSPRWQQTWGTDNWNPNTSTSTSFKPKPVNRSGLTKEQVLQKAASKDKDAISKMTEQEFQNTVLKPTGEIAKYKPGTTIDEMTYDPTQKSMVLKNRIPMSNQDYVKTFNENLDVLNDIISQKNKSGVEYKVKELTPDGRLVFETPKQAIPLELTDKQKANIDWLNRDPKDWIINKAGLKKRGDVWKLSDEAGGNEFDSMEDAIDFIRNEIKDLLKPKEISGKSTWAVNINPGEWRGNVEDIANTEYFRSIPGLEMSNTTSGVFADNIPRKGTGAYESINEYLKQLGLGRVKPGFNSQTKFSRGAWENFIKSGRGFGFYANPSTVYGTMRTIVPPAALIGAGAAASKKENKKYGGWLKKYK